MIVARLKHENLYDATLLATVAAAWTAAPDYIDPPAPRRLFRGFLLVTALAGGEVMDRLVERRLVAMAQSLDEVSDLHEATSDHDAPGPGVDVRTDRAMATPDVSPPWPGPDERGRPTVLAASIVGVACLGAVVGRLGQHVDDALATALRERGVVLPYTLVGLCWAAGVFAVRAAQVGPSRECPTGPR